ncbi:MAG: 5'-3' exonuclease H3TH domain-containing protein [Candidatus Peregrinibacteria bacterium]
MKKILLIDVSHLFFRAFYAFPRGLTDKNGRPINAVFGVAQMLFTLFENEKPDYIFGGKDLKEKTKRAELHSDYKAHRPALDPELAEQIPRVHDLFQAFGIPVFCEEGYEADDILASMAERMRGKREYEVEVYTGDQDALQLIDQNVWVLKPDPKENLRVTRESLFAKKQIFPEEIVDFKGLSGDPSDNLKGVEGIGEKGAVSLIRQYGKLESIFTALDEGAITGAIAKRLDAGREIAFFTREMATLHRNLALSNFDLEKGLLHDFNRDHLQTVFQEIGSQTLLKRMEFWSPSPSTISPVSSSFIPPAVKPEKEEKGGEQMAMF